MRRTSDSQQRNAMTMRTKTLGSLVVCLIFLIANLNGNSQICRAQDFEQGKALYEKTCASCHGGKGEGVSEHYDSPLTGDLSIPELAKVIQETMPEGAPNTLSSEDANRLAIFVHHEFYSPFAQLRNAPPRTELSHLTTDQYRRSVLDLMSPFVSRPAPWAPADGQDARGLTRVVAQGDWGKDRKEIEKKVDGKLVWDWGDGKPLPEIDHEKWQFRWSGSLYAPVTGDKSLRFDIGSSVYNSANLIDPSGAGLAINANKIDRQRVNLKLGRSFLNDNIIVNVGGDLDFNVRNTTSIQNGTFQWLPDLNIEFILTRDRKLRAIVFNRNSLDITGSNLGRRNRRGLSISYRKDFDNLF